MPMPRQSQSIAGEPEQSFLKGGCVDVLGLPFSMVHGECVDDAVATCNEVTGGKTVVSMVDGGGNTQWQVVRRISLTDMFLLYVVTVK